MAIERMKFISVTGPKQKFDEFIMDYIIPNDIQLENAESILDDMEGISAYIDENPYEELMQKGLFIREQMNLKYSYQPQAKEYSLDEMDEYINEIYDQIQTLLKRKSQMEGMITEKRQIINQVLPIRSLDVEVDKLFDFKFMKFRFGRMPKESYTKLQTYVENLDVVVINVFQEENMVYLLYFMPELFQETIDNLFSSLYFERIRISDQVSGAPKDALNKLEQELAKLEQDRKAVEGELVKYFNEKRKKFAEMYGAITELYQVFLVRKYAVHSKEAFFLAGWFPESILEKLYHSLEGQSEISCIIEDDKDIKKSTPPTALKNSRIIKPFETLIGMYGIPSYHEIDPTMFVAITYLLMFGMMFGDLGQGFVLALGGWIFYKKTQNDMGGVVMMAGISSMVFGVLYGSVFGNEELFQPIWLSPMEEKNLMMIVGISLGAGLIVIAMVFNIINGLKSKSIGQILFSKNGLAGLIFYGAILFFVVEYVLTGKFLTHPLFILLFFFVPLLIIFMEKPLERWVDKEERLLPEDKAGFFIEAFFELFEAILGFVSNTISFVRLSAFALNHVGLFMAVKVLAQMQRGAGSILVMIIGNLIIIGLEGLIVGIQGLRLEYYELFSRFFSGEGKSFNPFRIKYQ